MAATRDPMLMGQNRMRITARFVMPFILVITMLAPIGANRVLAAPLMSVSCQQVVPGGSLHFAGSGLANLLGSANALVINWAVAGTSQYSPTIVDNPLDSAGNLSLDFPVPTSTPGSYRVDITIGGASGGGFGWNITVTNSPNCSSSQPPPSNPSPTATIPPSGGQPGPSPTPQPPSGGSLPPGCTPIFVDNPGRTGGGVSCPQQPSIPSPPTNTPPQNPAPANPPVQQPQPSVTIPINPEQPVDPGPCANQGVFLGANGSTCGSSAPPTNGPTSSCPITVAISCGGSSTTQPNPPSNPPAGPTGTYPSAPGSVVVTSNPPDQVCVQWNGIDDANQYKIYDGSGNFIETAAVANTPKCLPSGMGTCFIVSAVTNNGETAKSAPSCMGGTTSSSGGQVLGDATGPTPTRGGSWVKPTTGHTYHVGEFVQFAATAYSSSGVDHVNFTIRPNIHEPHDWFIACPASPPVGASASDVFTCKWQVPAGIALGDAQIGFDVYDQAGNTNSPDGLRGITLAASPATFMQADTNDVYLVSGNTRFLIPDSDTLAAIALSPVITRVSPDQLNGFATGATLYSIHNLPIDLQPVPTADSSAHLIDPSSGSTFTISLPSYDDVATVYKALDILSNVLKVSGCLAPDAIPVAGLIATGGASAAASFSLLVINHSLNPVCLDLETWGAQQILGYDGPSYLLPPPVDENLMQIVPKRADE